MRRNLLSLFILSLCVLIININLINFNKSEEKYNYIFNSFDEKYIRPNADNLINKKIDINNYKKSSLLLLIVNCFLIYYVLIFIIYLNLKHFK